MSRSCHLVPVFALATFLGCMPASDSRAADPWSEVGSPTRPSWVQASAERRLRLLSALPAMKDKMHSQAQGYIGSQGPGLAVGLVLDDGLYYSQGFGFADAQKTHTPDENTIFRAGSLSKVITGTGLLTLIDDPARHMSLDDAADDQRFLPELKSVCPEFNKPCQRGSQNLGIKLKHLVSHTAGLANVMEQTNASVDAWRADLVKSWLLFHPGDFAAYSGVSIEGVGLIEQRVSGQSYVDFIGKNLFAPLGMKRSSMDETKLPQQSRAQKWLFTPTVVGEQCFESCNTSEQQCMGQAHGSAEKQACIQDKKACTTGCPPTHTSWSFSAFNQMIAGDDQPMIAPAGGLATSVEDLSLFIKMWLSGKAPTVNGRPLLKAQTINAAATSLFTAKTQPPAGCGGTSDANGFSYSPCGTAFGFGVNWYVGQSPYIEHNGDEPGVSGSNTRIDQPHKMGATGLVSTEPYPRTTPQAAGLDASFIDSVVYTLLDSARSADTATSWSGQALATGVARVLFLSGKKPDKSDLDALAHDFINAHHLNASNVVSFLTTWHNQVGRCSSFRVRDVRSGDKIEIVLPCEKAAWDIVLSVDEKAPHRIAWSEVSKAVVSGNTGGGKPKGQCTASCSTDEGQCMKQAHSSADRQACVHEKTACVASCK
jgi:CubicO group peptidase (beta-lactamase class C family)